jgi:hypothetical protein
MQIIPLNERSLAIGRKSFDGYLAAQMCGPQAFTYAPGMMRETGLQVVTGAIAAAIESGIADEDSIVNSVARVSRCARSTVRSILIALTGSDPDLHLWGCAHGQHFDLRRLERRTSNWAGAILTD